jgi:hypothetical protein
MTVFLITFAILLLVVVGMAIGTIAGRPAIKGSCGGLNQVGLSGSCGGACSSEERALCAKRKAAQQQDDDI